MYCPYKQNIYDTNPLENKKIQFEPSSAHEWLLPAICLNHINILETFSETELFGKVLPYSWLYYDHSIASQGCSHFTNKQKQPNNTGDQGYDSSTLLGHKENPAMQHWRISYISVICE